MQQLMASLVFGMSVDDAAYRAGMASARREARRTEQDFDRAGEGMADAIQRSALAVNRATLAMVDSFNSAVSGVKRAGLAMTVGLTLPLGLAGKSAKDTASDFQGAMNKVKAAMLTADPREIEKLRDAALELGPAMGRSSIEAAAAIESLAKNGMSAANILGGGLKLALTLAAVGEAELSDAADLTTDIMAQFGKTAGDLPKVVDLVSGALDASKMNFDDYRLAAGNAGGVVGALGYTFEDFNTGLAATAPLFDSGAQAGTSYRAFLTSLVGKSEDARRAMEQLGLEFYETEGANKGAAKSLAAIADQLKTKMGNLSDKSKGAFLNAMFGEDGAQTAVKLIQLGADGIERAQQSINSIRADQKVAVRLDGEAAATKRLAAAWEKLKIGIGEAGLIQVMTAIKNITASVVETIASAPPALFYLINGLGLVAAAAGPVVLGLGALVGIAAPLIVGMGSIGVAGRILVGVLGAIINPVGMLGRGLLFIAARAGAATVVARLSTALASLLGPIGLVITAASILWPMLKGLGEVSAATAKAQEDAARAHGEAEDAISRLSSATGKARVEAIAHVKALRAQHLQQLQTARSALALARAEYLQQKRDDDTARTQTGWNATKASFRSSAAYQWWTGKKDVVGAGKDFVGQGQALLDLISTIQAEDRALAASPLGPNLDLALADPKKTGGKGTDKSTRDTAADEARYQSQLGQLRVEMLRATADLTGQARDRYDAEMAAIAEDRAAFIRDNETNDALDKAQRATLLAAKDQALARQRDVAQTDLYTAEVTAAYEQARFANEAAQETVRAQMDLADSVAARREGELRLLKLQKELEAREIAHLLATEREGSDAYARALDRRAGLDALYAGREASARRQTEGPAEGYLRSINLSADGMRESIQAGGVDALRGLNSELVNAGFNVRKLGDAFTNMGHRIIATLAEIAIQQKIIRPMAERLFGDGESGGTGGWLGSLLKLGSTAARGSGGGMTGGNGSIGAGSGSVAGMGLIPIDFGGYRASGGPIQPNKWYMTGEKGPEPFFSGRPGTMLSNEALGSVGRRAPAVIQIVGDEGAAFVPRVTSVAGDVSVQTLGRGLRSTARQQGRAARQRLA